MYNLSRSQPRTLQRGCSTKVIDPELENSNAPEVEICSFSSFSGRMIAGHRTPFAPASSMRGISPSSAKKRRGIPSFRKPRPKGATKRTENVSFDPTAAAEPIPRVLFGCSALTPKSGRERDPENAAKFTDLSGWQLAGNGTVERGMETRRRGEQLAGAYRGRARHSATRRGTA